MGSRRGESELRRIHCECAFKLEEPGNITNDTAGGRVRVGENLGNEEERGEGGMAGKRNRVEETTVRVVEVVITQI